MSSAQFHQLWDFFMNNVSKHNAEQRQGMYEEAKTALTDVVNAAEAVPAAAADVSDIELVVGERMFQTGAARSVFTRYDANNVGKLTVEQFQRCIAEIDVQLSLPEVLAVKNHHDTDNSGSINYDSFIAAIIAKRQSATQTPASIARIQDMVKQRLGMAANNESAAPIDKPPSCGGDQPAVVQVLVKMNNLNLRKVFKTMDDDNDGLVSTDQLAAGLVSHGLTPAVANTGEFRDYVESYCKRKKGYFGYAEFVRFVNNRLSGQNTKISGEPLSGSEQVHTVPHDSTLREVVGIINSHTKHTSVSSVLKTLDLDDNGLLNQEEFAQGMKALGFIMSEHQLSELFSAFDHGNDGNIDLFEFGRAIYNPNRNAKLGAGYRHAPGGESSVALGGGQDDGDRNRTQTQNRYSNPPGGTTSHDFSENNPSPITVNANARTTNSYMSSHTFSDETLSGDAACRPGTATRANGATRRSTIDFAGDHGAPSEAPRARGHPTVSKTSQSTFQIGHDGDASHASNTATRSNLAVNASPGGISTVSFTAPMASETTRARGVSTPVGGRTTISFNQGDRDVVRPTTRVLSTPGGSDSVDLTMDHSTASDLSLGPPSQIKLKFDGETEEATARPVIANINQSPGGNSTVVLAAEVKKLGAGHLREISDAIYNKGRLRHTFQEFNSDSTGSTLSKQDLQIGLANLKVHVPPAELDSIYARFDKDGDGKLTYSEFVRLLATKS